MVNKKFELKEEHIKLLNSSYVSWEQGYNPFGVAVIDMKRPYGNSDVLGDIHFILTGEYSEDDLDEATIVYYVELHKETEMALQIILHTKSFEVGVYENSGYGKLWVKIK